MPLLFTITNQLGNLVKWIQYTLLLSAQLQSTCVSALPEEDKDAFTRVKQRKAEAS